MPLFWSFCEPRPSSKHHAPPQAHSAVISALPEILQHTQRRESYCSIGHKVGHGPPPEASVKTICSMCRFGEWQRGPAKWEGQDVKEAGAAKTLLAPETNAV